MLTPHVAFTWSAMANFDQDFAYRSLLGLSVNSVEELIYISQPTILLDSMPNFDEDFSFRSLLGLPANSIEELIYHNRKFYWTRWRILMKILQIGRASCRERV